MNHIKAVLFDLDNTILDRTRTFDRFTNLFIQNYFQNMESTQDIFNRIIELDQDGYKDTLIQHGKINQLGIRDDFDLIIVSEEAGIKKPDPGIFNMALEKLQLEPKECIFVGDHPVNDIEGAAKAGMETIWIQVNQPWRDEITAKPLHSIRKVGELLEIL
ncbi:HAD family hydrolase [Paenibacillus sp. KQZ6P-2]|uniref:HAD family hydrolase n=2 Tax=Paenibacillus mangrovi TaxID=2931978 RepID=A0A9X2B1D9_9BACL|nr:HAD family hydrolase [Paenibacillus mangrovi]